MFLDDFKNGEYFFVILFDLNLLSFRSPQPGHRVVLPETRQRV
jgi:hypothetical protein